MVDPYNESSVLPQYKNNNKMLVSVYVGIRPFQLDKKYIYSVGSSREAAYYTEKNMYCYMKTFVVVSTHNIYYCGGIKNNLVTSLTWVKEELL